MHAATTPSGCPCRLFEPYVIHVIGKLLNCYSDGSRLVREGAHAAARAIMANLSGQGQSPAAAHRTNTFLHLSLLNQYCPTLYPKPRLLYGLAMLTHSVWMCDHTRCEEEVHSCSLQCQE